MHIIQIPGGADSYSLHVTADSVKSLCPVIQVSGGQTLESCLLKGSQMKSNVINFLNGVCELLNCDPISDLKLTSGLGEWDVYVDDAALRTNTTYDDSTMRTTTTGAIPEAKFPVWAITAIVLAVVGTTVAVVAPVILYQRKRRNCGRDRGHVQESRNSRDISIYENTEASSEERTKPPDSTVYDEINSSDNSTQTHVTDAKLYQNASFHGDEHYLDLRQSEYVRPSVYTAI